MSSISGFEKAFTSVFSELNSAKVSAERNDKRRGVLTMSVLDPRNFSSSLFKRYLKPLTAQYLTMVHDMCVCHSGGLVAVLKLLAGMHGTCQILSKDMYSQEKVYICDLKQTKSMVVPASEEDYVKLFQCIDSLIIGTEYLNIGYINAHKGSRSKVHQSSGSNLVHVLRDDLKDGNDYAAGTFAAVIVWLLDTKSMNKQVVTFNSAACAAQLNKETMLLKKNPNDAIIQPTPTAEDAENEEEEESIEQTKPQAEPEPIQGEEVESWEDLDL